MKTKIIIYFFMMFLTFSGLYTVNAEDTSIDTSDALIDLFFSEMDSNETTNVNLTNEDESTSTPGINLNSASDVNIPITDKYSQEAKVASQETNDDGKVASVTGNGYVNQLPKTGPQEVFLLFLSFIIALLFFVVNRKKI